MSKKSYMVKSHITGGERDKDGNVETVTYEPGDTIELDEKEAWEIRHALEDPPDRPLRRGDMGRGFERAARQKRAETRDDLAPSDSELAALEEDDSDDDEIEEAVESIRRRPDNPESGVDLHWQRENSQPFGPGPSPRPASNMTEMEKEDRELKLKAARARQRSASDSSQKTQTASGQGSSQAPPKK